MADGVNVGDGFVEVSLDLDEASLAKTEAGLQAFFERNGNQISQRMSAATSDIKLDEAAIGRLGEGLGNRFGSNFRASSTAELNKLNDDVSRLFTEHGEESGRGFFSRFRAGATGGIGEFFSLFSSESEKGGSKSGLGFGAKFTEGFQSATSALPGGMEKLFASPEVIAAIAGVLFSLFFDFAGGARFFIRHTLTLSRDSAQAVSEERWFGKLTDRTVCNMNAIEYAQLEFARSGSKRIIFVMKNDSVIVPLRSSYTDEQGYYAVVNAINRFLGVPGRPAPQSEKDQ